MLPLLSFTRSLPAGLPFFSQSFGCKTASHFVEFLCRINICNCKALAGASVSGEGSEGWGADHPSALGALKPRAHLTPSCQEEEVPSQDTDSAARPPLCPQAGTPSELPCAGAGHRRHQHEGRVERLVCSPAVIPGSAGALAGREATALPPLPLPGEHGLLGST